MKKVGIIFGMETTFPPALVDKINSLGEPGVKPNWRRSAKSAWPSPRPTTSSSTASRTTFRSIAAI